MIDVKHDLIFVMLVLVLGSIMLFQVTQASLTDDVNNKNQGVLPLDVATTSLNTSIPLSFASSKTFSSDIIKNVSNAGDFNASLLLDNLVTFNATNTTVFVGGDVLPFSFPTVYWFNVTVLNTTIYNDHDGLGYGAGEIYFKVWTNGNYTLYPQSGYLSLNDGESATLNFNSFNWWAWNVSIRIEVWESDTDFDDFVGRIEHFITSPINQTLNLLTDTGDARVAFNVTSYTKSQKNVLTANELLGGFKPYLYVKGGTSGAEEPTESRGRVFLGHDETLQKDLLALQYFYYWDKEDYGGVDVHVNDFEEILVFLDPTNVSKPVRVAIDLGSGTLPTHDLNVLELGFGGVQTLDSTVDVIEEFQPFLGENISTTYTKSDLGSTLGPSLTPSLLGAVSINVTIATFYHTFSLGKDINLVNSKEVALNYSVLELSNVVLEKWYGTLNDTLHGGIHTVDIGTYSYITARISPFTFDVSNPFQEPYILNAWDNVMTNLAYLQKAKSFNLTLATSVSLTAALKQEAVLEFQVPTVVNPSSTYQINYTIKPFDETLLLVFDYNFTTQMHVKYWYVNKNYTFSHTGSIQLNVSKAAMETLLSKIGLSSENIENSILDQINEALGSQYFEVTDLSLDTTLLGHVLGTTVKVHAWNIVKDYLPRIVLIINPTAYRAVKTTLNIIDNFVLEHLDLIVDANLDSIVLVSVGVSDSNVASLDQNSIEFNETHQSGHLLLTTSSNLQNSATFQFSVTSINNGVDFYVDWYANIELKSITKFIFEALNYPTNWTIYLGRYPSLQKTIPSDYIQSNVTNAVIREFSMTSSSTTTTSRTLTTGNQSSTTTTSVGEGPPPPPPSSTPATQVRTPGFTKTLVIFGLLALIIIYRLSTRRKNR